LRRRSSFYTRLLLIAAFVDEIRRYLGTRFNGRWRISMIHSLRGAAFALPVFVAILSFGCSSGSSTAPDSGPVDSGKGPSDTGSTPTFTEVYTTVLAKNCTNSYMPL
jgi:hypothetical protein